MSLKPICVPCERFYRIKKAGYYFIEGMPEPGLREHPAHGKGALGWVPYKIWAGDLWECPTCGHKLVSGVGLKPLAEDYQEEFDTTAERTNAAQLVVKDC